MFTYLESKDISKLERMIVCVPSLSPIEPSLKRAKIDLEIVDEDESTCEGDVVWVEFDGSFLKQADRLELIQNMKLNDCHINHAQRILCRQFPNTEGLGHTLLQKRKPPKKIQNGLQIIHDRGDHWIVASNIGAESNIVKVYDSVFTSVSQGTTEVILNLFDLADSHMIEIVQMKKQDGSRDCGLFAIAVATHILLNENVSFCQQRMRNHLLQCFEANRLTKFP